MPRDSSSSRVRAVPAAVVPPAPASAPTPFVSISAMKLSLARFIVRTMVRSGGDDGGAEHPRARAASGPRGGGRRGRCRRPSKRGAHPLGRGQRGVGHVPGAGVARVVLVGGDRRQRCRVRRVVRGPARAEAPRVEEALVGDDGAAHQADAPPRGGGSRRRRGGSPRRAGTRRRTPGSRAAGRPRPAGRRGPRRVRPSRTVPGPASRRVVKRWSGPWAMRAPAPVRSFIVDAGMRGRVGPERRPRASRRRRRRCGRRGSWSGGSRRRRWRPPPARPPGARGRRGAEEQREGGDREGRRPARGACGYAVALSSRSASSAGSRCPAAVTDLTKSVLSIRPL